MKAILEYIQENQLTNIVVRQTGNIGMDSSEPIVQVIIGDAPKVTYGKVSPNIARRIMKEHVQAGNVVKEFTIEA